MVNASIAEQNPATPEEIWAILRETALRQKEHEAEAAQWRKEYELRWAEYDRRQEEEAKRREAEAKRREEVERAEARRREEAERAEAKRREAEAKRREEAERAEAKRREAKAKRREEVERAYDKRREEAELEDAKRREEWAIFEKKWGESLEKWDRADRQLKAMKSEVGGMSNTFGEMVEHLVIPGVEERLGELGFRFDDISPRRKIKDEKGEIDIEIDLLLANSDTIVAVEVKSKVRARDIEEDCMEKLKKFRKILDRKNDKRKLLGVIAGAVFGKEQKRLAQKAGLYVIVQSGDTVKLDVPDGFKPREW